MPKIPDVKADPKHLEAHGVTERDLDKLRHMIGMGSHIRRGSWGFRNHYAPGLADVPALQRLEAAGYVRPGAHYRDGAHFYHATEAGCLAVGLSKAATRRALGDR